MKLEFVKRNSEICMHMSFSLTWNVRPWLYYKNLASRKYIINDRIRNFLILFFFLPVETFSSEVLFLCHITDSFSPVSFSDGNLILSKVSIEEFSVAWIYEGKVLGFVLRIVIQDIWISLGDWGLNWFQ